MKPRILLVNPPVYDFAAYDFWLKPYGLLSVAGFLRGEADFALFDYLDRRHGSIVECGQFQSDKWGRGRFRQQRISLPGCLAGVLRYFRRFGLAREMFVDFLSQARRFDYVFIQTVMTYWHPGVKEVIEDIRKYQSKAKIILGGNYVTVCPEHAKQLDVDLIVAGCELGPLWEYLGIEPDLEQPALWQSYDDLKTGVLKLSDGCPYSCTYCSVPKVYGSFKPRSFEKAIAEVGLLISCGAKDIAFYDDALLYKADEVLLPFL
ncbi:MAG: hypothetical protein PVG93_02640, partial [Phycisphaerales bacterium]